MACDNCNPISNPISTQNIKVITSQFCNDTPCGVNSQDAKCVTYNGPTLSCTEIYAGNNLENIIQKFNTALCSSTGNYSGYNTYCLSALNPITSEKQFVEGISQQFCELKQTYNSFVTNTYVNYQGTVDTRFKAIEVPNVSAPSYIGASSTDTLQQILTKYSNKIGDLNSRLDLSTVTWDTCFSLSSNPTTLPQAFNTINAQICSLKQDIGTGGGSATLPTFNNTGSCLATPSATDSLVSTVNKIKDRLCTTPSFDINALTWSCLSKPSTTTTNLQAAFQSVLSKLDSIAQNLPTFTGDFAVTNVDNANACLGKRVALVTSSVADRYVAINTSDITPGTLSQKITAGAGMAIDVNTTPGTMIISSTVSALNDKVKSRSVDGTAGFLEDKILGVTNTTGVNIVTTTNTTSNKVEVGASVNKSALFTALLNQMSTDTDLKTLFCEFVQSCLPDCIIPPHVTYVISPSPSSTTTTTTTNNTL